MIARAGTPLVQLVPVHQPTERRQLGALTDKISFAPDWDSDETNEQIAVLFDGM